MKREHDASLDADERALAAQLRRLPPHGEPSADLDARILALARDAGAAPRRPAASPRRHWPAYASAAAICVLAAGLAWQLWPAHVQRDARLSAPDAAPAPETPAVSPAPPIEETPDESRAAPVPPPAAEIVPPAIEARREPSPQPPRPTPPAPPTPQPAIASTAEAAAPATASGTVSGNAAPAPVGTSATPPPPPPSIANAPAPPAPPAPAPAADSAAPAGAAAMANDAARSREAKSTAAVNAMRAKAAPDVEIENGYDARPPATVQDASVRNDWLKRIRELVANGDREGARASLQEYKSRYPDATIPADLQPLLASPPAKTP